MIIFAVILSSAIVIVFVVFLFVSICCASSFSFLFDGFCMFVRLLLLQLSAVFVPSFALNPLLSLFSFRLLFAQFVRNFPSNGKHDGRYRRNDLLRCRPHASHSGIRISSSLRETQKSECSDGRHARCMPSCRPR